MLQTEYWVWLQNALGAGQRVREALQAFASPKEIYNASTAQRRLAGVFSPCQLNKLEETTLDGALRVIEDCRKNSWSIITPDDEVYPERLRSLDDFPLALYLDGTLPEIDSEVCISIVGTRKASVYGVEAATRLSAGLARAGAIIVSGGALGIDSAAHQGALAVKGKTIAVLGCGFGTGYLRSNDGMRRAIAATCCVMTEFPPFMHATKYTFPIRNRLISALSLGTVVVEAAVRSGALITARLARSQGRDVFAVSGSVIDPANNGTNHLIHDGAKPVFCPLDVLEEYPRFHGKLNLKGAGTLLSDAPLSGAQPAQTHPVEEKKKKPAVNNSRTPQNIIKKEPAVSPSREAPPPEAVSPPEGASPLAAQIWELLGDGEQHIDFLSAQAGVSASRVLCAVTELELYGAVKIAAGRRIKRC